MNETIIQKNFNFNGVYEDEAKKDLKGRLMAFINRFDYGVSYRVDASPVGIVYVFIFEKWLFPLEKDKIEKRINRIFNNIISVYKGE